MSLKLKVVVSFLGISCASLAMANSAQNAQNLQLGLQKAQMVISRIIQSAGGTAGGGGAGGGGDPWGGGAGGGDPWGGGAGGGDPWGGGAGGGDPWGGGAGGGGDPWGGGAGGRDPWGGGAGGNPWFYREDVLADLEESDALALPILVQAQGSLGQAASFNDQAKMAFLSGNFQFGNFRFAQGCNFMGIARSQLARANTAALVPPQGFLAAFGPDLTAQVIELNALRMTAGCP